MSFSKEEIHNCSRFISERFFSVTAGLAASFLSFFVSCLLPLAEISPSPLLVSSKLVIEVAVIRLERKRRSLLPLLFAGSVPGDFVSLGCEIVTNCGHLKQYVFAFSKSGVDEKIQVEIITGLPLIL